MFLFGAAILTASGEMVRLNPVADTTLFQKNPDHNLGAVDTLAAGTTAAGPRSRALIEFGITNGVPANAMIKSVTLLITAIKAPVSGGKPSVLQLNRLLQNWGEGIKAGGPLGSAATSNEATWNARFQGQSSWSKPGAAAPSDFLESASAATIVSSLGQYRFSSAQLVEDVQTWLADPASNFGWILWSQNEAIAETARRFGSREHSTDPPALVIEYEAPEPPFSIDLTEKADRQFRLGFLAKGGTAHVVECTEILAAPDWKVLTNLTAQATATNVVISDGIAGQQRFYRVGRLKAAP